MNKNELSMAVYDKCGNELGMSKSDVAAVVSAVFDTVTETVKNSEEVTIQNFGKWSVGVKKARRGRNPKTGEEINIPEKKSIKFAVAAKIKTDLNA